MLSPNEESKVKDTLRLLGLRKDLNLAYFLNNIVDSNQKIDNLENLLSRILQNQKALESKLDLILRKI